MVARYIHAAVALAVVVRCFVWVGTWLMVGPVLGSTSFALSAMGFGAGAPQGVEFPLVVLAVVTGVVIGTGVRRDADRWRRRAVGFGWVFAADAVWYVASIVVALAVPDGWESLVEDGGWSVLAISLINAGLLWMGVTIARRARRMRGRPRSRTGYRRKSRLPLRS
ncbi:MAG TPA: hypothetical protein VF657_06075 [Actinoplanes sp.]